MAMRALVITERITKRETESFKKYLQEVDNIDRLTPDQEYEIALKAYAGDEEARTQLVTANLRFVISVAKQYANNTISLEDLVNEGNLGMVEAAKRFDPHQGFKFISYAVWWIRRSIFEYLTKHSRTIRIPSNQAANITKLGEIVALLEQKLERAADLEDIMLLPEVVEGKFSEKDIEFFLALETTNTSSLDKPFGEDGESTLIDTIESDTFASSDSYTNKADEKFNADALIGLLTKDMQKYVIIRFFGLDGEEPQDLRQIADRLKISRERARQIKDNGLRIIIEKSKSKNLRWMLEK